MMKKMVYETNENYINENKTEALDSLKAHIIGDRALTITTLVLVCISLYFDMQFAPFIILLMSSRIGSSLYAFIKTASKKEFCKLMVWCALFGKSALSCWQFFALIA